MAARPVPCGLFPGLIPGSQNADWPPATGDWADAAHCVPDTDEKLSTVIAGGGAVRPDSGDGKSTTTGTSVRPYGSASKVIVRMPMGKRPSWSTPPHVHLDACARDATATRRRATTTTLMNTPQHRLSFVSARSRSRVSGYNSH